MFNVQFEITNGCVTFTNRSSILIVITTTYIIWIVLTVTARKSRQNDEHSGKPRKKHLSTLEGEREWHLFFHGFIKRWYFTLPPNSFLAVLIHMKDE